MDWMPTLGSRIRQSLDLIVLFEQYYTNLYSVLKSMYTNVPISTLVSIVRIDLFGHTKNVSTHEM